MYLPHSQTLPYRYRGQGGYVSSYHRQQPPSWVIRLIKALIIGGPVSVFLLTAMLLFSVDRGSMRSAVRTTTPASYEEYVQKEGLCRPSMDAVSRNSTNVTALNIYDACLAIQQMEMKFFVKSETKVHPFLHTYVIKGDKICDSSTEVILIVHAYHDFYDRRQAIRETWGGAIVNNQWPNRQIKTKVKLVFMFGMHANKSKNNRLKVESMRYSDVVQGSFQDSYKNMTLKSLMGLKWVSEYCPSAKYLVKSDDDMIINFPYLETVLRETDMTWSIMGPLNKGARVYRKSSKWAISTDIYPFYYYPQYESGSTYIISSDLVRPMFDTAEYVPQLSIDDVYITGIIGRILNVNHKQQAGFAFWINKAPKVCDIIQDKILTGTRMKPKLQYTLWNDIAKHKC